MTLKPPTPVCRLGVSEVSMRIAPLLLLLACRNEGAPENTAEVSDEVEIPGDVPSCEESALTSVRVAPGTFQMGSPASELGRKDNEAQHQVTLKRAYCIGTTEVSADAFASTMGYTPTEEDGAGDPGEPCEGDCPVTNVSWHEAAAFTNALSADAGLMPCYACTGTDSSVRCSEAVQPRKCSGYRLPTEAEWENAARAGSAAAFPTGLELHSQVEQTCTALAPPVMDLGPDRIAWYCANADGLKPTAQLRPNAWGLYDTSGNVWEWVHDLFLNDLGEDPVSDPNPQKGSLLRAVRGGSWRYYARFARSASRAGGPDATQYDDLGFRVARTLPSGG